MLLAEKIAALRKRNAWSQEELAGQLDVSRQSVSKWESGASIPDLDRILALSNLFGVSVDYLLKEEMEEEPTGLQPVEDERQRVVGLEAANEFMDAKIKGAKKAAIATAAYVCSPVPLLLMASLAESDAYRLSNEMAGGLGAVILLLIIGLATAFHISNGMKMETYEYLEKECFYLAYGVEGVVRKRMAEYTGIRKICLAAGVFLCIICAVPLFIVTAFGAADSVMILCVAVLLSMVSFAVYLFVLSGERFNCFQMLLQEGEYTPKEKLEKKRLQYLPGIYWGVITAVYLGISFVTGAWQRTWIIWPCAGVMYAVVLNIIKLASRKDM